MEFVMLFGVGLLATTLGTMAGGGGLINLPVMLMMGIPIHSAIGANKVSNTVSAFSSFFYLYKKKELSLRDSAWIIPVSLGGGVTGGWIASSLPTEQLEWIAIVLLIFAFVTSFLGKGTFTGKGALKRTKGSAAGLYGIGLYDGLFGPGQGTLMLYLFSALQVSYLKAVGIGRLATFSSCVGAAVTYIVNGHILWPLTIALLLGSLTGAQLGVRLAQKITTRQLTPLLRIVTLILIIQVALSL